VKGRDGYNCDIGRLRSLNSLCERAEAVGVKYDVVAFRVEAHKSIKMEDENACRDKQVKGRALVEKAVYKDIVG
jgi:hypothetical protein